MIARAALIAVAAAGLVAACGGGRDDDAPSMPTVPTDTTPQRRPLDRTPSYPTTTMATDYTHAGQQRILRLINVLAGHEITGISPADISAETKVLPSTVTRDLDNLRSAGFAEQVPETGRWRLSPQMVQIALRHMTALDRAQSRLDEVRNRFSRGA